MLNSAQQQWLPDWALSPRAGIVMAENPTCSDVNVRP